MPCAFCPESDNDFAKVYTAHPEALRLGAVAIVRPLASGAAGGGGRVGDGRVVGAIVLNAHGVPASANDAWMHTCAEDEVYISWVALEPGHRRKGIGTKLLAWAEITARAHGATRLTLDVKAGSQAVGLYERLGYNRRRRARQCYRSVCTCLMFGITMVSMEKPL